MSEIQKTIYTHRFLAKVVLQAETPLAISSGEKDILTDAPVMLDANGLPYIPATSIAGIIRHAIGDEKANRFFGYQTPGVDRDGQGSKIIFTSAHILGEQGEVIDGLQNIDFKSDYYKHFNVLPIRQHVRINSAGTAEKGGKFDEQVIYKGTRFCFEIEMVSSDDKTTDFDSIIEQLKYNIFRIGGGSRNGFGAVSIKGYKKAILNLTKAGELQKYLDKSSDLSNNTFWGDYEGESIEKSESADWTVYKRILIPDDFFLFGSGFGSDNADMTPVKGTVIEWNNTNVPEFNDEFVLIPASSVKGALSHRVAFYYNQLTGVVADDFTEKEMKMHTGKNNEAVKILFGSEKNTKNDEDIPTRGNCIFFDIIEKPNKELKTKILNHVSIDRFTGGAIPGALFNEEVIYGNGQEFTLQILVKTNILKNKTIKDSFEKALKDICDGMLPLGGGVNRGNGCFKEKINKDGQTTQLHAQ